MTKKEILKQLKTLTQGIESLFDKFDELEEEKNDIQERLYNVLKDREDNYRQLKVEEQIDYSDRW